MKKRNLFDLLNIGYIGKNKLICALLHHTRSDLDGRRITVRHAVKNQNDALTTSARVYLPKVISLVRRLKSSRVLGSAYYYYYFLDATCVHIVVARPALHATCLPSTRDGHSRTSARSGRSRRRGVTLAARAMRVPIDNSN